MNPRLFLLGCLASLVFVLGGCAQVTPSLNPLSQPEPGSSYLYGRFQLKALDTTAGGLTLILVLQEKKSGHEYFLRFIPSNDIVAIALPPGSYSIMKWLYISPSGNRKEKPLSSKAQAIDLNLAAGKCHYLGDFRAEAQSRREGTSITYLWQIEAVLDYFQLTSDEFHRRFPGFRNLPTVRTVSDAPMDHSHDLDDFKDLLPKSKDHAKDLDDFRDLVPQK